MYSPYSVLLLVTAIVSLYLSVFVLKKYPNYKFFFLFLVSSAIWSFGYAMEIWSGDINAKILWAKFEYIGITTIPVAWFITILQYTGKDKWLSRRNIFLLFIMPAVTTFLAWTNEWHHLIWKKIELTSFNSSSALLLTHGNFFWIHATYSYILLFLSIAFLLHAFLYFPSVYRGRIATLIAGAVIPWIGNIIYVFFYMKPLKHFDTTPITAFVSGILMTWAVAKLKAFDVIPIAKERIIETISDGIVVVDSKGHIIYANKAALAAARAKKIVGKPFKNVFGFDATKDRFDVEINGRCYHVSISPIKDENGLGKTVILHDITDRKKAEDKIRQLNEELMLINKIVRHDILNDLQIIQGFLEMEYKGDKEIFEKLMKRIEKSVRLMKRAKDLEHIASIEEMKEYDMRKVVESVAKGYDAKINIEGECRIKADDSIYSLIDNIIMNAIIHGKASKIDILLEENEECVIKIADNGSGIPDEIKSKIFEERFSYGDAKGSGLGLYIVKKIVEKFDGSIEVKDNEPRGAIFIIKLRKK